MVHIGEETYGIDIKNRLQSKVSNFSDISKRELSKFKNKTMKNKIYAKIAAILIVVKAMLFSTNFFSIRFIKNLKHIFLLFHKN